MKDTTRVTEQKKKNEFHRSLNRNEIIDQTQKIIKCHLKGTHPKKQKSHWIRRKRPLCDPIAKYFDVFARQQIVLILMLFSS